MTGSAMELIAEIASYAGVSFTAPRPTALVLSRDTAAKAHADFSADGAPCSKNDFGIDGVRYTGRNKNWWKPGKMAFRMEDGQCLFREDGKEWFQPFADGEIPPSLVNVGNKCQQRYPRG